MLNFWVNNLRIFTYFYVFIIPSNFLNALVFQKRIYKKNYVYILPSNFSKFLGFYFTYFLDFFLYLKSCIFFRVRKFDANLKIRIFT